MTTPAHFRLEPREPSALDRDHFQSTSAHPPSVIHRWFLVACALALATGTRAAEPDARHGEALFVGAERLTGGGAPCLGCHAIAGQGLARAASFGPDLTGAHAQYGAEGLNGLLEDVVFPSMAPVYQGRAITATERADLVAFLAGAGGGEPASLGGAFAGGIAAAAGAFLVLVIAIGRRGRTRRERALPGAGRTP
jgi:hypothetical protein